MTGRSTGPSCCPAPTRSASAASPGSWPPRRGSSASGNPPPSPPRPAPPLARTLASVWCRCPICRDLVRIPPGGLLALPPSFMVNQLMDLMARQKRETIPTCSLHPGQVLVTRCPHSCLTSTLPGAALLRDLRPGVLPRVCGRQPHQPQQPHQPHQPHQHHGPGPQQPRHQQQQQPQQYYQVSAVTRDT